MRTPEDTDYTDKLAEDIGYVAPPRGLEPPAPIGASGRWSLLSDWFETHTTNWHDSILVYCSRRWNISIGEAYLASDNFAKDELARRDRIEDPNAVVSFN